MICIGNPQSFAFAEDVIDALIEIFPSQYIHFGGDEVPTDIWEECPKCMALYKTRRNEISGGNSGLLHS